MQTQDIMIQIIVYANMTADCRHAIESGQVSKLKELQSEKEAKFNEIETLIKIAQKDAVIKELKTTIDTLS